MPTNWKIMPRCPTCGEQHWLGFISGLCYWCEHRAVQLALRNPHADHAYK